MLQTLLDRWLRRLRPTPTFPDIVVHDTVHDFADWGPEPETERERIYEEISSIRDEQLKLPLTPARVSALERRLVSIERRLSVVEARIKP